jgi:1-acyl-sn-glycerol-3-phosphate acyltransferase
VSNHSGTLPFDGIMIKTAVKREHPQRRDVRWLAEDFIFHFPFLGAFSNRVGAVRACQENAELSAFRSSRSGNQYSERRKRTASVMYWVSCVAGLSTSGSTSRCARNVDWSSSSSSTAG